jgi:hypothetical protein
MTAATREKVDQRYMATDRSLGHETLPGWSHGTLTSYQIAYRSATRVALIPRRYSGVAACICTPFDRHFNCLRIWLFFSRLDWLGKLVYFVSISIHIHDEDHC